MLFIITVVEPSITTPGPCGGTGEGVAHIWISDIPARLVIVLLKAASAADFADCSAA
jgi:hypothetical protein